MRRKWQACLEEVVVARLQGVNQHCCPSLGATSGGGRMLCPPFCLDLIGILNVAAIQRWAHQTVVGLTMEVPHGKTFLQTSCSEYQRVEIDVPQSPKVTEQ